MGLRMKLRILLKIPFFLSRDKMVLESPQLINKKCFGVINRAVQVVPERSVKLSRSSRSSSRKAALIAVDKVFVSYLVSSTFLNNFENFFPVIMLGLASP